MQSISLSPKNKKCDKICAFFLKQKKKKENVNFQTDHESVIFTKELMKGENKIVSLYF